MKKLIALILFTGILFPGFSQNIFFKDTSLIPTGFFYNLSYPVSGIERFDGTYDCSANSLKNWKQIYFELGKASLFPEAITPFGNIDEEVKELLHKGVIPFGFLDFRYNRIIGENRSVFEQNNAGDLLIKDSELISEFTVFSAAALKDFAHNGSNVKFLISKDFYFSNNDLPLFFEIDFDNNSGFLNCKFGDILNINYSQTGAKTIFVKAHYPDGKVQHARFYFDVRDLLTPQPSDTWLVESEIPYNGNYASGDVFLYLADGHTNLENPVIISEGFDLTGEMDWEVLYNLFNQQNLLENLVSEGFDAVILNFHEPLTYIQENAFLFVKLLQTVNDTINYRKPVSVVGPSMGGLVCRYALTYMENEGLNHNTELFISFDVPHQGANMPLGLQYMCYFFKDLDPGVQEILDLLSSPASRQMLVYFYTDPPSNTATHDIYFDDLLNDFLSIGNYPQNLRKIAISNGRGDGIGQPYDAGDQLILYEYNSLLIDITGNIWAVENNATGQIFEGLIDMPWPLPDDELDVIVFSEKPYDNAPGGSRSTLADMDSISAPYGDIIALHGSHCFIPTVSALDLNVSDLFYNVLEDPQIMQKTPFDTIYVADENYEHIYISAGIAQIIFDEIMTTKQHRQIINISAGWSSLSSFIIPGNPEIDSVLQPLINELIIIQHFGEIYWPDGGINTIGDLDNQKGYLIKLGIETQLTISGFLMSEKTVTISQGWNLIPVLSPIDVDIMELFSGNIENVEIIKEAAGYKVFWPAMGISTLQNLQHGKAYFVKALDEFTIVY